MAAKAQVGLAGAYVVKRDVHPERTSIAAYLPPPVEIGDLVGQVGGEGTSQLSLL